MEEVNEFRLFLSQSGEKCKLRFTSKEEEVKGYVFYFFNLIFNVEIIKSVNKKAN